MRIVLTRPPAQSEPLAERLRALGHDVVLCPLIEIEPLGDEPLELSGYDWVVVTSANGARELARRSRGSLPRLAAVGPATAAELRTAGLEAALVPRVATQEGLLAEFPRPPGRVLVAAAEGARRLLVEALAADFLPLYRTRELRPAAPPDGDLGVVASGSAARALAATGVALPVVSIGPQTTRAARASGLRVVAEARTHDVDGLVAAVEEAVKLQPWRSSPS